MTVLIHHTLLYLCVVLLSKFSGNWHHFRWDFFLCVVVGSRIVDVINTHNDTILEGHYV